MFGLGKEEAKNLDKWLKEHDKTCTFILGDTFPASGGRMTYCFTPTGLGVCTIAKCICGEEKNITNFEGW